MIPRQGSSHSMATALLLSAMRMSERSRSAAHGVSAAATPGFSRVILYLPLAWLLQLIVSDLLHLFFHACTSLSTSARGWGWGMPGHMLGAIGYIHTVHHKHVDAFGTVNREYQWASLLLDKLLKRSLTQYISWRLWCGVLRLNHLVGGFMHVRRSSAPRARFAMALLMRLEVLKSALLVMQTVLHHCGQFSSGPASNSSRRGRCIGCPLTRLEDHPPLGWLPRDSAQRLASAIGTGDPQALLQWRVFTSPVAHSLHHYYVWNFPFQVVDWHALILLLRGGQLEWAEMAQAAELAWGGLIELPPNSRRTGWLNGPELRHVYAASVAALAPLRCAELRLALAKAMRGGPESTTYCLADDLHALIGLRLTVRRVELGMVCRGDVDACINTSKSQYATIHPAAVRRPHLSFLGAFSGLPPTSSACGRFGDRAQRRPLYVVRRVLGRRRNRDHGNMELLIEWEDGEAPPPPAQCGEDEIEELVIGSVGHAAEVQTASAASGSSNPGSLLAGHVYGATGQPQREEVDFQVDGAAGGSPGASSFTQWVQKATAERYVGREMVREAMLAYHRKVSHIARLVASG